MPHQGPERVLNRPGFTAGQNSQGIAHDGTDIKEETLKAVFTRCLAARVYLREKVSSANVRCDCRWYTAMTISLRLRR